MMLSLSFKTRHMEIENKWTLAICLNVAFIHWDQCLLLNENWMNKVFNTHLLWQWLGPLPYYAWCMQAQRRQRKDIFIETCSTPVMLLVYYYVEYFEKMCLIAIVNQAITAWSAIVLTWCYFNDCFAPTVFYKLRDFSVHKTDILGWLLEGFFQLVKQ